MISVYYLTGIYGLTETDDLDEHWSSFGDNLNSLKDFIKMKNIFWHLTDIKLRCATLLHKKNSVH